MIGDLAALSLSLVRSANLTAGRDYSHLND
jgi:hypothetical protein